MTLGPDILGSGRRILCYLPAPGKDPGKRQKVSSIDEKCGVSKAVFQALQGIKWQLP
jgi:hypothetical protein